MSHHIPLIYIAGKFRGPTPLDVRRNVETARDAGMLVAQTGGYPVIPHTMTCDFDKQLTDEFWLAGTLALMLRCDAVFLVANWRESAGATAERDAAVAIDMPIFDDLARLRTWVEAYQQVQAQRERRGALSSSLSSVVATSEAAMAEAPSTTDTAATDTATTKPPTQPS